MLAFLPVGVQLGVPGLDAKRESEQFTGVLFEVTLST